MLWATYGKISQEGIKGIIAEPQNWAEPVGKLVEALVGKLISYHLMLNAEIDFFIITDMPDDKIAEVSMIDAMLVSARRRRCAIHGKSPADGSSHDI
jgi:hypothetical protein